MALSSRTVKPFRSMKILKTLRSLFSSVDIVTITFLLFLDALNVIFHARVGQWLGLVLANTVVIVAIAALAWMAETRRTKILIGLHRWYCYPIIMFLFKEIYLMVYPIHPHDYDALLIAVDHWMFGVNPTQWLASYSNPILTEILQIAYFSYYLLFIVMGVEVYRRYPIAKFDHAAFLVVYGFYLSYLGYFLLPAIGPRFTLHDFSLLNQELPGIALTTNLRAIINAGESIPSNVALARELIQRDAFPSGHTQLSLIVLYLGFRNNLRSRWLLTTLGGLLLVGTVYLRYHYVVDLLGGALFFWFTIWSGNKIEAWWSRGKDEA